MHSFKIVTEPADVVYVYDGSLPGLFCCVRESAYKREMPQDIVPQDTAQPHLFEQRTIITDTEAAGLVRDSIATKISARTLELIETVFLSCLKNKELAILKFLILAYEKGANAIEMEGNEAVSVMLKAERHLLGERHLLLGFVRFSDYDGILAGTISPKNFILPFIANHFTQRYSNEEFIIYDKTNKAALIYKNGKCEITKAPEAAFPEASPDEEHYRALWKQFYKTIAIEARENPKCRMTHMPKRYWENMTEMK